jgi:hypothetical protein
MAHRVSFRVTQAPWIIKSKSVPLRLVLNMGAP